MEDLDLKLIFDYYNKKLLTVKSKFHRYLYDEINWKSRLIGIIGARGVGKTTMLIQRIKENFLDLNSVMYASLDQLWFNTHTLYELAQYASSHGITHLFLDEVHRYKNWSQEIKMIYDTYPDINIVYTGSSILEINKAKTDLSRRQTLYHLYGMSFREFLAIEGVPNIPLLTLEQLLSDHQRIALSITEEIKILPHFERYLTDGYYPFYIDAKEDYLIRLSEIIQTALDIDLPSVIDINYVTVQKAKKLFAFIAQSTPFVPNLPVLFQSIEVSRDKGLELLNLMCQADLLSILSTKKLNYKNLVIPEKIFLQNSNMMYALSDKVEIGAAREAFFLNQVAIRHDVVMPKQGDFMVDDTYLFEIGGRKKSYRQIADIKDSYLAVDNTEVGYGNRIPLWMFGLLY